MPSRRATLHLKKVRQVYVRFSPLTHQPPTSTRRPSTVGKELDGACRRLAIMTIACPYRRQLFWTCRGLHASPDKSSATLLVKQRLRRQEEVAKRRLTALPACWQGVSDCPDWHSLPGLRHI
jgi:hypothetical protein